MKSSLVGFIFLFCVLYIYKCVYCRNKEYLVLKASKNGGEILLDQSDLIQILNGILPSKFDSTIQYDDLSNLVKEIKRIMASQKDKLPNDIQTILQLIDDNNPIDPDTSNNLNSKEEWMSLIASKITKIMFNTRNKRMIPISENEEEMTTTAGGDNENP